VSLPDSELAQLGCGKKSPIAICCGIGRTRMQNPAETDLSTGKNLLSAFKGKIADCDKPFGFQDANDVPQMIITRGE